MLDGLGRGLRYADWLFNPFRSLGVEQIYDLVGRATPTGRRLYLNLGYWDRASNPDDACEDMAELVAATAGFAPGQTILDCGFGFADQDILWARRFAPWRILGLNVTASQVELARRRVREAGVDDVVELRVGSATAMPMAAESVDAIVALESAFHFDTRERFFGEALRVLRPGGRLVTADIIPTARQAHGRQDLVWRMVARKFAIPAENAYPLEGYRDRLRRSGFEQIEVRSIRDLVYGPLHRFFRQHPTWLRNLHPLARLPAWMLLSLDAEDALGGLDYVIASARRPSRPTA
jgi:SAM-dependent methyltransferase